jgi:hypothetical protein
VEDRGSQTPILLSSIRYSRSSVFLKRLDAHC